MSADHALSKLRHHPVLAAQPRLVRKLMRNGQRRTVLEGEVLCEQGSMAHSLFFILHGEFRIEVNNRPIGVRKSGQTIGELSAVDPSMPRSATVVAKINSEILEIDLDTLDRISSKEGLFYKNIAREIASRLRSRDRFIPTANSIAQVIFLSSSECIGTADELARLVPTLTAAVCRTWQSPGVFLPGDYPLTSLMAQLDVCDFAVALASGDDIRQRRSTGEERVSPRDNILFEIGLFIGRLGAHRTLILDPTSGEGSPSDLDGVTAIRYEADAGGSHPVAPSDVAHRVAQHIEWHGPDRSIRQFTS